MSENKFTPGPWKVRENGGFMQAVEAKKDWLVYKCGKDYMGRVELEANARLIAAAPDLLQALVNLVSAYSEPDDRVCCNGVDCGCFGATKHQEAEHYARAAIAKARGE